MKSRCGPAAVKRSFFHQCHWETGKAEKSDESESEELPENNPIIPARDRNYVYIQGTVSTQQWGFFAFFRGIGPLGRQISARGKNAGIIIHREANYMKKKSKKWLCCIGAGCCLTLPAPAVWAAEDTSLEAVIVESEHDRTMPGGNVYRTSWQGPLGKADFMNIPANTVSYTSQVIQKSFLPTRTFFNAVTNNPSIMVGGASTDNNVELQIRGIAFNTHDILLDGVPGMMMMQNQPMNWVERIEVMAGPNTVMSNTGFLKTAAGFINFVPKKAEDKPVLDVTETYSSSRLFTHSIDWGQRFGSQNRYGIRMNGETYAGHTSMKGENLREKDLYINMDQKTSHSRSSFLMGYDSTVHHGMPEIVKISSSVWGTSVTHLPSAKKAAENYMPSWTEMTHRRYVYVMQHEQKLNDHLSVYLKGGYQKRLWPGYVDGKPQLLNDAGDYSLSIDPSSTMSKWTRRTLMAGVNGDFRTGAVRHHAAAGWDYMSQDSYSTFSEADVLNLTGNLYDGTLIQTGTSRPDTPGGIWYLGSKTYERSLFLADSMEALQGRLTVTAGIRHQNIRTSSFSKTGTKTKQYDKSADSPAFGVVYRLAPRVSLYANYAESLGVASVPSSAANKNDVLPPFKTKQYEIGVKWDRTSWASTLSLFRIKQPVGMTDSNNYYSMDGETRNRGAEWNIFGRIAPRLSVTGGIMWLDAKYMKTQGGTSNGKRVYGTPRMNATMALDWETPVKGLTVNGRVMYFGDSYADRSNAIRVPSWTRIDLGAQYDTSIQTVPVTFHAMAYNVTNKKYWSSVTTAYGETGLTLNPGRTYIISATMHL